MLETAHDTVAPQLETAARVLLHRISPSGKALASLQHRPGLHMSGMLMLCLQHQVWEEVREEDQQKSQIPQRIMRTSQI